MNPTGTCRLCLEEKILQDSHLLPKSVYKVLRSDDGKNPVPILISTKGGTVLPKQVKDYLLCRDCEERFNKQGENWMLSHCYRESGSFFLRDKLLKTRPAFSANNSHVFAAAKISDINHSQIVYFAASVLWRAAVHTWKLPFADNVQTDLGIYEDSLRLFLLGEAPVPHHMAMLIHVSASTILLDPCILPNQQKHTGYDVHSFVIPGMTFQLHVGPQISPDVLPFCAAHSPVGPILVLPEVDQDFLEATIKMANKHGHLFS